MRIIYVTTSLPKGPGETFIIPEIQALQRLGHVVWVVPVRPRGDVVHRDAGDLLPAALVQGFVSASVVRSAVTVFLRSPRASLRVLMRVLETSRPRILIKNLAVYPKGLWLSRVARSLDADHIHAHWGGTTATVALTAAETGHVPWSFSVHRWDIAENNLLGRKAGSACFVRAISQDGLRDLRGHLGDTQVRDVVIHMGVDTSETTLIPHDAVTGPIRVLVPASLVPVKGHDVLLEAVRQLQTTSAIPLRVTLAGDGPLRGELENRVASLQLEESVEFLGQLPHDELLGRLQAGEWNMVVLTSVPTSGEKEGIPIALAEAMSVGIPVIASDIGGVSELLSDGAGVLVQPGAPRELADAIQRLAVKDSLRVELGARGRARVLREFSSDSTGRELEGLFAECRP